MIEGNRVARVPSRPEDSEVTIDFPWGEGVQEEHGSRIRAAMMQLIDANKELANHYPGSEFAVDREQGVISVTNHFNDLPLEVAERESVDAALKIGAEYGIEFKNEHPKRYLRPLGSAGLNPRN